MKLEDLQTLAQANALPRAVAKKYTQLERAIANKAARLLDTRLLRLWAFSVKSRDQWHDRKTGERLRRQFDLDPLRAEAHHIEPKEDWAVRYDVRNGLCLSFATHFAIEHGRLRVDGTVFFYVGGKKYIDGRFPVTFVRT